MKKLIFTITIFFLALNSSNALTLTCPSIASPGENIICQLEDDQYIGLTANYQIDEYFTYNILTATPSWKTYYDYSTGFSIGNVSTQDKLSASLNLTISENTPLNQDYNIKLSNIEVVTTDYKYNNIADLTSTIKVVSNINTLKSLEVVEHELSPEFNSDTTTYNITTKKEKVEIKATPTDEAATLTGDLGEKTLTYGINSFSINVTSVKGETKTYQIHITREMEEIKKSNDFTLKSLTITPGKINFKKDKFLYKTKVDYEVEKVEVVAVANSDKATVNISNPEKLEVGENNIIITVTAEDGTVGTYSIIVTRKEPPVKEEEKEEEKEDAGSKNEDNSTTDNKEPSYNNNQDTPKEEDKTPEETPPSPEPPLDETPSIDKPQEDLPPKEDNHNTDSLANHLSIIPIILFVILGITLIVVKIIKKQHNNN